MAHLRIDLKGQAKRDLCPLLRARAIAVSLENVPTAFTIQPTVSPNTEDKKPMIDNDSSETADPASKLPHTQRLLQIMGTLRSPDGCPWDRKQTLETLKPYLIEESAEVLEAIEEEDPDWLKDELGDLLLQIVFQSQICSEKEFFDFEDVARTICEKMIRRHPHVFADVDIDSEEGLRRNWDRIKREEKGDVDSFGSILPDIPRHLPALMRAKSLQKAAIKNGLHDGPPARTLKNLVGKIEGLHQSLSEQKTHSELKEEIGDILFTIVSVARQLGVGPEEALNQTIRNFRDRFRSVENALKKEGKSPDELSAEDLKRLWQKSPD
ncbi:MAG: nucleoside triphosphate pyrophosphohydrolase [Planctomycetes bacterium]|nr:nucleoside triphosphate pyrophosphohydrolase [Planctomycetota bacterium]